MFPGREGIVAIIHPHRPEYFPVVLMPPVYHNTKRVQSLIMKRRFKHFTHFAPMTILIPYPITVEDSAYV